MSVKITNNPYQGLKRIQVYADNIAYRVKITNNPYQGLKQRGERGIDADDI